MIKVLINGACGRMGKEVERIVEASETMTVAAKVDKMAAESGCYTDINDFSGAADVIIDFSSPENLRERLEYAKTHGLGIVLASTGFSKDDLALIDAYAKDVAIFKTANLSLGINVLQALCKLRA